MCCGWLFEGTQKGQVKVKGIHRKSGRQEGGLVG